MMTNLGILSVWTIISFLIHHGYSSEINKLAEIERQSLEMFKLLHARRLDYDDLNHNAELSISQFLETEAKQEELKALAKEYSKLTNYKSSLEKSQQKYFEDVQEQFQTSFAMYLSLGLVRLWPTYFYHSNFKKIVLIPEEIVQVQSAEVDDLGPPVPKFENIKDLLETVNVYKVPNVFENDVKWIPETPERLKQHYFYELNHIIPLALLVNFCKVFSATWSVLSQNERKTLSAPFQVLEAFEGTKKTINAGMDLANNKSKELKQRFSDELNFENYILNRVLWAPGNLFYGFKNRVKPHETFQMGNDVIIGSGRFKKAYYLYNRMSNLLDRVEHTEREGIQYLKLDESWVTEVTEILVKFMYFGNERSSPYQIDWRQWEYNDVLHVWTLKSKEEYVRLLESLNATKKPDETEERDNRVSVALMMDSRCNISGDYNRSRVTDDDEYMKFENFQVKSIMSSKNDAMTVLKKVLKNVSDHITSVDKLVGFVRKETKDYYNSQQCDKENLICVKANAVCQFDVKGNFKINCNENSKSCPKNLIKKRRFIATPSFIDWCNGSRFENKYQLTTDSILTRILSFNTTELNNFNEKIYYHFYREKEEYAFGEDVDLLPYLKMKLLKFDSPANKILNQACKIYKESDNENESKSEESSFEKFFSSIF